jgi:hypothetical protein
MKKCDGISSIPPFPVPTVSDAQFAEPVQEAGVQRVGEEFEASPMAGTILYVIKSGVALFKPA